jgi:hypothetical protein
MGKVPASRYLPAYRLKSDNGGQISSGDSLLWIGYARNRQRNAERSRQCSLRVFQRRSSNNSKAIRRGHMYSL